MLLKESLAFAAVIETEPVRRLPWSGETPTGILAASSVLANVSKRSLIARLHKFAGAGRFVAHWFCRRLSASI